MCGRYTITTGNRSAVGLRFGLEIGPELEPTLGRFNVAPGQEVLAIRSPDGRDREAVAARWGLVPGWADDLNAGYRMINARSETVLESRAYGPLAGKPQSRCLIPADGFFEWMAPSSDGGPKRPVRFTVDGGELFSMAGLITTREWEGAELVSCTILTTEADAAVAPVHDRMPVILADREGEATWIGGQMPGEEVTRLTRPLDPERVSSRLASPYLNRVGAVPECPELLESEWGGPGSLFD